MKKSKKQDDSLRYLAASGIIRMRENDLVDDERRDRILAAKTGAEAYRVIRECGYDLTDVRVNKTGVEGMYVFSELMRRARIELYAFADSVTESRAVTDFFRVRTDCHNIKTILKSQAAHIDPKPLLLPDGTIPTDELLRKLSSGKPGALDGAFGAAADEARQILDRLGDGQRADFLIDRAMLDEQARLAEESEVDCLKTYAERLADGANLRTAVRLMRLRDGAALLKDALSERGTIDQKKLIRAAQSGTLPELYRGTVFEKAAMLANEAETGAETLAALESACTEAENQLFDKTQYVAAGPILLVHYLVRREQEFKMLRKLMSEKLRVTA